MINKIKNFALFISVSLLSQHFMSCKKDNNMNTSSINTSSVDKAMSLPADTGLIAWYTFTNGSLRDKSGHGNGIKFSSATPANGREGQSNKAYYFDGSSSYMTVKNDASLSPAEGITLAALIKPMGFYQGRCHYNRILTKGYNDNVNGRYSLGFTDQSFYNYLGCDKPVKENHEDFYGTYGNASANASGATDTNNIKVNNWYSIVYTCDGLSSKLYVNGVLKITNAISTSFSPNNDPLYIGKTQDPNFPYYFKGVIDEIRIYNRPLSTEEILGLDNFMGKDK